MTTTLIGISRRHRRARWPEGLDRRVSAHPARLTDTFDVRQRLNTIVDAAVLVPGVELLSAGLDPLDGAIRIELLAPTLSAPERLSREAQIRSTVDPDSHNGGMITLEFVDSAFG